MNERPNWFIGVIAAALVLVVVGVVVVVTRGGGSATLEVSSIPGDLRLTMDGKVVAQNGQTTIRAGKHTLVASRSGFADQTESFQVRGGEGWHLIGTYSVALDAGKGQTYDASLVAFHLVSITG